MYKVRRTSQFKKDYKLAIKRNYDIFVLQKVVAMLQAGEPLPDKYLDHPLTGNWRGYRECHLLPDWLLVYKLENDVLLLTLTRTGSHGDIFS